MRLASITTVAAAATTAFAQCHPELIDMFGGAPRHVAVDADHLFVVADTGGLHIFDREATPARLGSIDTPGIARSVTVSEGVAYVADEDAGMFVADVSDPSDPVFLAQMETADKVFEVEVVDDLAYVCATDAGLLIVDVSSPSDPVVLATHDEVVATDVIIDGDVAMVAGIPVQLVDVSDPENPETLSTYLPQATSLRLAVVGHVAFLAQNGGIEFVDVSDPTSPKLIDVLPLLLGDPEELIAHDTFLYSTTDTGNTYAIDVSDPGRPHILGIKETPGEPLGLAFADETLFVAAWHAGVRLIDESDPGSLVDAGAVLIPSDARGIRFGLDIGYLRQFNALHTLDLSDPARPSPLGAHFVDGFMVTDLARMGDFILLTDRDNIFQVIDVNQPDDPELIGELQLPGDLQGLDVEGHVAYVASSAFGLQTIDISDPAVPEKIGAIFTSGSAKDVVALDDSAYVADGENGLVVIDVSDPTAPAMVTALPIDGDVDEVQHHDGFLYVLDQDAAMHVIDPADPARPSLVATVTLPNDPTGIALRHDLAMISIGTGVRLFDLSDPASPAFLLQMDTPDIALGVGIDGDKAYVCDRAAGVVTYDMGSCLPCPADFNTDGIANVLDFVAFQLAWSDESETADCDANAILDILDFLCFKQIFEEGCDP